MENTNVNTILGRSDNFVVVPALGPLVVGHVLVISTKHTVGLQYLSATVQENYERLSEKLGQYCARSGDTVLQAEHGAHSTSTRGPCIRHTHVHILPALANASKIFDQNASPELVHKASDLLGPYLWINSGSQRKIYNASRAIGQEIRRSVGQYLGIEDWDWAVDPKAKLIAQTIKYWSKFNQCLA